MTADDRKQRDFAAIFVVADAYTRPSCGLLGMDGLSVYLFVSELNKGVALTGRNTTGPPRAAPGELRCICKRYRRR